MIGRGLGPSDPATKSDEGRLIYDFVDRGDMCLLSTQPLALSLSIFWNF